MLRDSGDGGWYEWDVVCGDEEKYGSPGKPMTRVIRFIKAFGRCLLVLVAYASCVQTNVHVGLCSR